jgi:hypothetical protein
MSQLQARILLPTDKELLLAFSRARLDAKISDEMEREMQSWSARWRPEALDHYLPQGWSFGVFENGKLLSYGLAQPYLFHRGLTQTLWIEKFAWNTMPAAQLLIDTLYKWARDKHFQCLLVEKNENTVFILEQFKQAQPIEGGLIELKSARF